MARLNLLLENPEIYFLKLVSEIHELTRLAKKKKMQLAVRLNGTSDIVWESKKMGRILPRLMELFPKVVFYDYTKMAQRCTAAYKKKHGLEKYWLTFSRSETNHAEAVRLLKKGQNVAVVFNKRKSQDLPTTWEGVTVVNGDKSDLRFLDPQGVVVGLRYKHTTRTGAAYLNAEAKQSDFIIREETDNVIYPGRAERVLPMPMS